MAPTPQATKDVIVYLVRGGRLAAAGPRKVPADSPAMGAIVSLLAGPATGDVQAGLKTAIPAGTSVGNLRIASGTARIDLSKPFASGTDAATLRLRLAQAVFTLTQLLGIKGVSFSIGGKALGSLGGISLAKPVARADFEAQLPAIFVESPLPNEQVTSPLHLSGSADVFEAQFVAELWSPDGTRLLHRIVHAASGSGTRGDFVSKLEFPDTVHGLGRLKVYEFSAKDGSAINVVTIPVKL